MGVTIFRPGQRLVIPGVTVMQPRPSAAAGGWWDVAGQTCVAAYAAKGAADLAASYVNLANPGTYNAAPGVAPTWDATGGWTFNGTTQYLTTGIVIGSAYTCIVRFSGAALSGWTTILGATRLSGTVNRYYIRAYEAAQRTYGYGSSAVSRGTAAAAGVAAITPTQGYFDGSADGLTYSATWSDYLIALLLGAEMRESTPGNFFNGKIQALAIYSTTLSGADVATLTTAMNAL